MYLSYERVTADDTAKGVSALTVPAGATHAEIQADTNNVRYTMDGSTEADSTVGMLFLTTEGPKQFVIEDVKSISFHQVAAGAGAINIHYFGGRNI